MQISSDYNGRTTVIRVLSQACYAGHCINTEDDCASNVLAASVCERT